MIYSEQLKIARIKAQADSDFYFFCKHILGNAAMEEQPHQEVCDFLTAWKKRKKLMLLPRGGFKSTVGTVSYTLRALIDNPNLRVLIVSASLDNAKTYLSLIKTQIEKNELFKALYGDLKPHKGVWRETEIDIATKQVSSGKEYSIAVAGVGQDRTGMHYDLIILDDIVNKDNIGTSEQIKKTLDYYRLMNSILDPTARMLIIGTRYHFDDLYGTILEKEAKYYDKLVKNCYDGPDGLWFPSRFPHSKLDELKTTQEAEHFANQYLNNPLSSELAVFKQDYIKYYKELPDNLRHYILTDAAVSTNPDADFSAILVVGVDEDNNIYVVESVEKRLVPALFINTIFEKVVEYQVHMQGVVTLETNSMQQLFKHYIYEEMDRRKFWFGIHELKPNTRISKERKIRGLEPYFRAGRIWLKEDMHSLINQIIRFPKTRHDDLIDALSGIIGIMAPAVAETKIEKHDHLSANEKWLWDQVKKETSRKVQRKKYKI